MTARFSTESRRATYARGRRAELAAIDYLQQQDLELLHHNYRAPCGEIDIVMRDKQTLVFIEVRYRARETFCHAVETVGSIKQQRIRATAQHYLQQHRDYRNLDCRFDVILLRGPEQSPACDWLVNAF